MECSLQTTSAQVAREIMGRNYFGEEEAYAHLGISRTPRELLPFTTVPCGHELLDMCKDTHILVAVFPRSISSIRSYMLETSRLNVFDPFAWYCTQVFARNRSDDCWVLLAKEPLAHSYKKTWVAQQALLGEAEEVPNAHTVVYATIGHFLNTGERILSTVAVRTDDCGTEGYRIEVGFFDPQGLSIDSGEDDSPYDDLGLAVMKKLG
jgi:hypothetical protein